MYVRKIFPKTNISNPLIRTRTCAYQKVRNVSFSENFTYVLNGWPQMKSKEINLNIDLNTQIQWLNYSIIQKVTNLFIWLALQKNHAMFIHCKSYTSVAFLLKYQHSKMLWCSNSNVSLNLYMYIRSPHKYSKNWNFFSRQRFHL